MMKSIILAFVALLTLTNTISINADNNDIINQRNLQTQFGTFTGSFTLVKADINAGTLAEIELQSFNNGDTVFINNYPGVSAFSMHFHLSGTPFDSVSLFYDNKLQPEGQPPYGLAGNFNNLFPKADMLKIPGTKTIVLNGYQGTNIKTRILVSQLTVTFTIVTGTTVSTPAPLTVAAPVSLPPVIIPMPIAMPVAMPTKVPTRGKPTFAPPVSLSNGKWIVTNMNAPIQARHEACFLMVGRKAVLIGGRGIKRPDIYDPVTRTWTFGSNPPDDIVLNHMQCVAVGSKIWIVAAWTGSFPKETNAPFMYTYDVATDIWETKPPMPENRRRGSTAVIAVGNMIYVAFGNIGGHETANHATAYAWLDEYNIRTGVWKVLPDANYPRDHTGGALMRDGRICIAGGRDGGTNNWPLIFETECYNIKTKTWTIEANIPTGRAGSSYGSTCDGNLIVAGGEIFATKKAVTNFEVFDGKTWTILPSLNIARHSTGLAVDCVCNQIYTVSGSGRAGGTPELKSIETFFPNGINTQCMA